jgi:predicted HicB family RNase H-like nuclease
MAKSKNMREPIPEQFGTIEEAAEFWDTHNLADYWDLTEEVNFEVNIHHRRYLVAVDPELAERLATEAHRRGLSTETLINLWLSEKLQQAAGT